MVSHACDSMRMYYEVEPNANITQLSRWRSYIAAKADGKCDWFCKHLVINQSTGQCETLTELLC